MSDQQSKQQKGQQQESQQKQQESQQKQQGHQQGSNILETSATWVSALILLAAAVFLVYEGLRPSYPPTFNVTTGDVRQSFERYYLPLKIENTGNQSARAVTVVVTLMQDGNTAAESSVTVPWLPASSARLATVAFSEDPREYNTVVQIQGYLEP